MPKTGDGNEHWTKMNRHTMECPAWRALSLPAQAIYPWLKLEWKGPRANNNGKIQLSLRQIAERAGCNIKTAGRAIHDLQRKGWIVVRQPAQLGLSGEARSHQIELTEIACPPDRRPRALFREWKPGVDFPIAEVRTNNPTGANGRKIPVPSRGMTRPPKGDEPRGHVPSWGTARPTNGDEPAQFAPRHVPSKGTPLSTRGMGTEDRSEPRRNGGSE